MEKEIVNQVQEVQRVPYRINPRRNMPRHILIKRTETARKKISRETPKRKLPKMVEEQQIQSGWNRISKEKNNFR